LSHFIASREDIIVSLDDIRKQLDDRNLRVVAERIDINYRTLLKFYKGDMENPSFKMIDSIIKYLER